MAPAPNPQPLPVTPSQATKQQAQPHQQLAQHLHRARTQADAQQRIYPQPPTPTPKAVTPIEPMTNGYDERGKGELVMHPRAQHPFTTVGQIKSAFPGQKRGFLAENIVLFLAVIAVTTGIAQMVSHSL